MALFDESDFAVLGLRCFGVGRDSENPKALCFSFSRPPTDDELRALHDLVRRECYRIGGD